MLNISMGGVGYETSIPSKKKVVDGNHRRQVRE